MKRYVNKVIKEKEGSVVTLQQAKQQLNVEEDFVDDNEHILFLIESATGAAEDYTGTDISLTLNTLEYHEFRGMFLRIDEHPLRNVVSIIATDKDGIETEIVDYTVQKRYTDFIIRFEETLIAYKLVIKFETGYDIDEAPYQVINAILVKLTSLYDEERNSYMSGINLRNTQAFERLLNGNVISRW